MIVLFGAVLALIVGPVLNIVVRRVSRGPDRGSQALVGPRDALVIVGTVAAFAAVGWWLGASWQLPAFWYLAAVSLTLALIDLDVQRLPDTIVLPSYPIGLALLTLAALNPGGDAQSFEALLSAVLGAMAMGAAYLLIVVVYPPGMGLGDVKLAGVLGLFLGFAGWPAVLVGWFAGFALGGVYVLGLLASGRAGRTSRVPFGPWMLAGAWIGVLTGPAVGAWYLSLAGL